MSKQDESRRAFLVGQRRAPALLQPQRWCRTPMLKIRSSPPKARSRFRRREARRVLNDEEAAAVAAFAERIMPGAPGKAGAREVNVLNYIDLALAGAYADLQEF